MSSNPQDVAKVFLDQWQQQWTQLAADPAWQQMAQQQWQQFMQGMMTMPTHGVQMSGTSGKVDTHDNTGAAAHSPAPDFGAQLLAECFMRLARLETRVADLESRLSKSTKSG